MRIWPISLWLVSLVSVALSALAGGCTPLSLYNRLTPSDADAVLAKADVPYGQHPRQRLDVFRPDVGQPRTREAAPVVVIVYGGSWNSGRKEDYSFLGKAFAARGFVAMVIDYRLVPEVRFPKFLDDCALATHWAHTHAAAFGGDPQRVFLLGHSAGAYNAAMIALDGRYLTAAGSRPSIIRGVAALAGPFDFLPLDVASTQAAFGAAADLNQTQPVNFASSAAPPMFLATGDDDDDDTVKPRNTRALAQKLTAAGAKVTVKTYPGIGHAGIMLALSRSLRGRAPVLDDVTAFFDSLR